MSDLPPGWTQTTLGEIADTSLGKMLDRGKTQGDHLVPYLRNSNVQWGHIDLDDVLTMDIPPEEQEFFGLRPGDLLVCEGGEIGRCAIWPGSSGYMAFQKALHRVRPRGGIPAKFFFYLLEYLSKTGVLSTFATGSTIKHLPQEQLRRLPVSLPPLEEQLRIVATLEDHLSRVDAGGTYLDQASQHELRLRIAIYTAAAEGRLIASPQAAAPVAERFKAERQSRWRNAHGDRKYKSPVEPDLGIEPFVPVSWQVVSLEAATDSARLIQYGILMPRVKTEGSVPYVEVKDLAGETLSGKNLHRTSRELDEQFSKSRLAKYDVVMAVRGSYERSAVVPEELEGANVSRDVVRIAPLTDLDPDYLHIYLQSAFSRRYFAHHARGVAVKGVNTASVRSLPVVIPALEVQHEIVREVSHCISAVNKISTEISYARRRASNLRKSLLAETFTGRLVPQDPTDEPASVLLERIRAEEQAAQPRGRRGRRIAKQTPQGETLL